MTMLLLDGLDINDTRIMNEYAKLMYCPLYKEKFKNDFEWNGVRREILRRVQTKAEFFRTSYEIVAPIYLDRYNFESQEFPLTARSKLVRVGMFNMFNGQDNPLPMEKGIFCDATLPSLVFPTSYSFFIDRPFTLDRLKIPMDEAEKLISKMETLGIQDRKLYLRLRLRAYYSKVEIFKDGGTKKVVGGDLSGELLAADIFLDRDTSMHVMNVYTR